MGLCSIIREIAVYVTPPWLWVRVSRSISFSVSVVLAPSFQSAHFSQTSGGGWFPRMFPCSPNSLVWQMLTTGILSSDCSCTRLSGLGTTVSTARKSEGNGGQRLCTQTPDWPMGQGKEGKHRNTPKEPNPPRPDRSPLLYLTLFQWH